MAARVNVKFAIALAAGVFLVGGAGVLVAYLALNKTGDEYVARGDAALAAGDLELAAQNYEDAVGHDRTRIDWLEKWRSTLIQLTPPTQAEYEKSFSRHYLGILEQMAVQEWDDPDRQRTLIEERYKQTLTLFPSDPGSWQRIADLVRERAERLDQSAASTRAIWRYRGLAILAQMSLTDVEQTIRDQGLEDLRTAIEADPADIESARGVVLWHEIMWRKAYLDRRTAEARRLEQAVDRELAALAEAFPDAPGALLMPLEIKLDRISVTESNEVAQLTAARSLLGEEAPAVTAYRAAPPGTVSPADLLRLQGLLSNLGVPDRLEIMLELVNNAIGTDSVDPRLYVLKADILGGLGRSDEAIAVVRDYLAEPVRPVSLDGLIQRYFRPQALVRLADHAMAKWESAKTEEEKSAALAIAKDAQTQLNETTQGGERSAEALMVAGKLAQAEGRTQEAVRVFTELVEKLGRNDSDTRWRLAQALRSADQLGASKSQLQLILDTEPSNLRALLSLADLHARLREEPQARAIIATIRELYPQLTQIDAIEERLDNLLNADPEVEATRTLIAQARSLRANNSAEGLDAAHALLAPAVEANPENIALAIELVDVEAMRGQVAESRRIVARALTFHPNQPNLVRLQRSLEFEDPYAAAIALIADTEMTPAQKIARQYVLATRYNKQAEADNYRRVMRTEHADTPAVIELLFSHALRNQNFAEARDLVALAAQTNADQANGLVFQGQLEMVEGRTEAASRTLRQAAEILPYNSQLLLMLGQTELSLGRVSDGLRTLGRAYNAKPDDARVAMRYARTLIELQRRQEALEVARAAVRLNSLNLELVNIWLELEAAVGDQDVALRERLRLREEFPADRQNTLALANMLIKSEEWDRAESLISTLESEGSAIETVLLRARLTALRVGVDEGQAVIADYLAGLVDAPENANLMIALADFLFEFGEPDKAVAVLEDARDQQSSELMEVDRRLGDFYFGNNEFETALGHYQAVLGANADRENRVRLRVAETLTRLDRFDEANRVLADVDTTGGDGLTALLIQARSAAAQGDRTRARSLYDRAVELKPNDPAPFLQRAQFNAQDESQFNDALADIDQAIRLQPDHVIARRMKAEMLAARGRQSEAVAEIRRAIDSDPASDDLRTLLIQLLVSINDFPSAISFANRTVADRAGDLGWVKISGDLNARAAEVANDPVRRQEYWRAAGDRYQELHAAEPDDQARLRLANARLLQLNPDGAQALDLIDSMTPESLARGDIMILRARALNAAGRRDDANAAARSALTKVDRPIQLRVWFDQLQQMVGSPIEAGRFAEKLTPPAGLEDLFELVLLSKLSTDASRQSELLERLVAIEGRFTAREDLVDYHRTRGRVEFQLERYEDSAASFAAGLEQFPGDLEFNNNLAYLRSAFLGDPQGALAPARQAAAIAPQNPNILDTLGWVYFQTGQMSQAQQALQSARQYATNPSEYIPIELHLAEVFLAKSDRPQAIRLYQSARERLLDAPGLGALYSEDLESLRRRLDQAE